jgi:2-C-methyl-D-erythritol 2,4-cyclodiphosphate synthase
MDIRIGQGFDAHHLVPDRDLILCGEKIPHSKGLLGHSDADVAVHAVMDAIMGALSLGDIGQRFPDNDPQYSGADSMGLLKALLNDSEPSKWELINLDVTIIAQAPKLQPYILQMKKNLSKTFNVQVNQVSIKATTTEKMGFCGREEGIAATAVVLLHHTQVN